MKFQEFNPHSGAPGAPALGHARDDLCDVLTNSKRLDKFNKVELRQKADKEFRIKRFISGLDQKIPSVGGALICVLVDEDLSKRRQSMLHGAEILDVRIDSAEVARDAWSAYTSYRMVGGLRFVEERFTSKVYVWVTASP